MHVVTGNPNRAASQRGIAVIVMVVLMAILAILVASNIRSLWALKQELRLVERKQVRRLQTGVTNTNAVGQVAPVAGEGATGK